MLSTQRNWKLGRLGAYRELWMLEVTLDEESAKGKEVVAA